MGKSIEFNLDPKEQTLGEADGTGVPIRGIDKRGKEMKIFAQYKRNGTMVQSKTDRLEKLISFCAVKGYKHSTAYLENAKPDMFTAINNRL